MGVMGRRLAGWKLQRLRFTSRIMIVSKNKQQAEDVPPVAYLLG
jgi:hypothetical protein